MSKIFNVRLPNAAQQGYSAEQFNQLVRSLEQIVFQLNNTYTPIVSEDRAGAGSWFAAGSGAGGGFAGGVRGFQISNGISLPSAMIVSDADQTNASITAENLLTYTSVDSDTGVRVVDNSKIYMPCSGQYLVTFTLQVTNRGNTAAEFEVWAKDAGVDGADASVWADVCVLHAPPPWFQIVR